MNEADEKAAGASMGSALGAAAVLLAGATVASAGITPRPKFEVRTYAVSHCDAAGDRVITIRHSWSSVPTGTKELQFTLGRQQLRSVQLGVPVAVSVGPPNPATLRQFASCPAAPAGGCEASPPTGTSVVESIEFRLSAGELIAGKKISGEFRLREPGYAPSTFLQGEFADVPITVKSGEACG
jgi:hypothetical protein